MFQYRLYWYYIRNMRCLATTWSIVYLSCCIWDPCQRLNFFATVNRILNNVNFYFQVMREMLNRSWSMPLTMVTACGTGCMAYYLLKKQGTDEPFWLIAGLSSGMLIPYTRALISPINAQFRRCGTDAVKDVDWKLLLQKWRTYNKPRGISMMLLFCYGVYSLATNWWLTRIIFDVTPGYT